MFGFGTMMDWVTASSAAATTATSTVGEELDSLQRIQNDIDARLSEQTEPMPIYQTEEWAAYLDDTSGLVYYYNLVEKKSVWDPPSEEFLEKVKMTMMESPEKFGSLRETRSEGVGILGEDVTREVKREEGILGEDVTREVTREEVNARVEDEQVEADKKVFFMQEVEVDVATRRSLVDYDAAVRLAYDASGSVDDFDSFRTKYLVDTSATVATKHKDRMEEAARVAEELKAAQQAQLELELSLARSPVDYDATVRLAFEASGSKEDFDSFRTKYLVDTSAMVATKHKVRMEEAARIADELKAVQQAQLELELSLARSPVDYDAAVRLAYEASGSKGEFDAFREKYLVDTSAMVADKFNMRIKTAPISPAVTQEVEIESRVSIESSSDPFFFLDAEVDRKASKTTTEQVEGQKQSEVSEAPPQLPKDDPFASGSDVASLISPLRTETLYDILQCDMSATRSEIKRSYITLAKETHPDALLQNGIIDDKEAEKRFNEIARAYKILSDPTERRRYNRELKAKGMSRSAGNLFENWVLGAAKAMDEALTKAEKDLESSKSMESS